MYDYSCLRGKIREKFKSEKAFATALGLSHNSLSKKLNNLIDFTQTEIMRSIFLLDIEQYLIEKYFFTEKVQNIELIKSILKGVK